MKMRNRIMSLVLAVACTSGVGIVAAAPAQAFPWTGYSVGVMSEDECEYRLANAIREKQNAAFRIRNIQHCAPSDNGYWNGYFQYGD